MRDPSIMARSWLNKAKTEKDCFDRFVFLWFAFNALYNEFLQERKPEFQAIGDLVYSQSYRLDNQIINRILGGQSVEFFKLRVIRDCRGSGRDTSECIAKINSNNSPKNKLKSLLSILYQVRCNLFHGNKMYGRDSDNEVVENAANVLMDIIEAYIN